jgi:plastocyanin domain-containing protein
MVVMTGSQIGVTVAGIAAIGWIFWHFFVAARHAVVPVVTPAGTQEITIVVDGGYAPAVVEVRSGHPVRLHFDRRDSGSCTEEVVLPDFGVRRFLPTGTTTTVEFTPMAPGTYDFACGMGMVHGKLRVRE